MVIITLGQDKFLIDSFDSLPNQNELIINIHFTFRHHDVFKLFRGRYKLFLRMNFGNNFQI